jgi:hypothetical protein
MRIIAIRNHIQILDQVNDLRQMTKRAEAVDGPVCQRETTGAGSFGID